MNDAERNTCINDIEDGLSVNRIIYINGASKSTLKYGELIQHNLAVSDMKLRSFDRRLRVTGTMSAIRLMTDRLRQLDSLTYFIPGRTSPISARPTRRMGARLLM